MRGTETNDPAVLALRALGWTLAEPARAARLVALTGLEPGDLRARIGDPAVLAATLGFLADHEPDLNACAAGIGASPAELVAARVALQP